MKDFTLMCCLLLAFFGCKKENPNIIPSPEPVVQDSIDVLFAGDTIRFSPSGCINENDLLSPLISLSMREDSFGIKRITFVRTADSSYCEGYKLGIGLEITDKIENYPVTREIMQTHLQQIQNKTITTSKLLIRFTTNCDTYQNFERVFHDSIQLYGFSKNERFDYELNDFKIKDGSNCGYNNPTDLLVEMEGSFSGYLYSTPNVVERDSIYVDCADFKVLLLHDQMN